MNRKIGIRLPPPSQEGGCAIPNKGKAPHATHAEELPALTQRNHETNKAPPEGAPTWSLRTAIVASMACTVAGLLVLVCVRNVQPPRQTDTVGASVGRSPGAGTSFLKHDPVPATPSHSAGTLHRHIPGGVVGCPAPAGSPRLPPSVRQLCRVMRGNMWAEMQTFFTTPSPLKIAFANLEVQVGKKPVGQLISTKCAQYFNKSVGGGHGGRVQEYSYKFAAELLLPHGLKQSPYFSPDAAAADWVVLEICVIGRTWQGQIQADIGRFLDADLRTRWLWANGTAPTATRLLLTLVGDHGPCKQSNEKVNQFKKRIWVAPSVEPLSLLLNEGSRQGGCYSPAKDLTVPTSATVLGRPRRTSCEEGTGSARKNLAFFSGKINSDVRKDIYKHLKGTAGLLVPDKMTPNEYGCALRSSTFCIAARGNAAWSPRLDESIRAGCIPVLMADNYDPPFSHVLNYASFSVSVLEADIRRLPEILRAIPEGAKQQMQENIQRVQ